MKARPGVVIALLLLLFSGGIAGCGGAHRIQAYNAFAIRCAQAQLWREASFRWKQILEIDPNYAPAYNNLGVAYEALERFDEALEAYDRAIALDPTNEAYRFNRDRCLKQKEGILDKDSLSERSVDEPIEFFEE